MSRRFNNSLVKIRRRKETKFWQPYINCYLRLIIYRLGWKVHTEVKIIGYWCDYLNGTIYHDLKEAKWELVARTVVPIWYDYTKLENYKLGFDPVFMNLLQIGIAEDIARVQAMGFGSSLEPDVRALLTHLNLGGSLREFMYEYNFLDKELEQRLVLKHDDLENLLSFWNKTILWPQGLLAFNFVLTQKAVTQKQPFFTAPETILDGIDYLPKNSFFLFSRLYIYNYQKKLVVFGLWYDVFFNLYPLAYIFRSLNLKNLKFILYVNPHLVQISRNLFSSIMYCLLNFSSKLLNTNFDIFINLNVNTVVFLCNYFKVNFDLSSILSFMVRYKKSCYDTSNTDYLLCIEGAQEKTNQEVFDMYIKNNKNFTLYTFQWGWKLLVDFYIIWLRMNNGDFQRINFMAYNNAEILKQSALIHGNCFNILLQFLENRNLLLLSYKEIYYKEQVYYIINWFDLESYFKASGFNYGLEYFFSFIRFINLNMGNYNFIELINDGGKIQILINKQINWFKNELSVDLRQTFDEIQKREAEGYQHGKVHKKKLKSMRKLKSFQTLEHILFLFFNNLNLVQPKLNTKAISYVENPRLNVKMEPKQIKPFVIFFLGVLTGQLQEVCNREAFGLEFNRSWAMNSFIISFTVLRRVYSYLGFKFDPYSIFSLIGYLNSSGFLPGKIKLELVAFKYSNGFDWCIIFEGQMWELFFEWAKFSLLYVEHMSKKKYPFF